MKLFNAIFSIGMLLFLAEPLWAENVLPIARPPITTQPPPPPKAERVEARLWNLQDADILSVINEVSLETGKNFIIDPRVNGKISLISSKPIKSNEVYEIFLSVLSLLGYSAIPSGDVVKIVPNMESGEYATRLATRQKPGTGDEVVVRVIPLENASATQLLPVLRPLLPQWSSITAYTPGNVLVIVGRAGNLVRIMDIINNVDKAAANNIEIVSLRHASASQVSTVLNNLQTAAKASGDTSSITIAADERTNSILLSGTQSARLRLKLLITEMDLPASGGQGNTEVIYLKYLIAKNFAPILGKIAQNLMGKNTSSSPDTSSLTAATPAGGATPNTSPPSGNLVPGRSKEAENNTNIQAEPSTNSLIITAPPTMMRSLRAIVARLDIRPAQVLVEGILVEIAQDDLKNLGIQWGGLVTDTTPAPLPGFTPWGEGVIGIIPHQQALAVLNALQTNNNINILSTPSVVVLDNQKAALDIGQDVPVQTGSYATTGSSSTVSPFTTTSYRKVALVLEVTPQINLGNSVRMTVKIKNDTLQNPANPGPTPLINTSQVTNSVIVNSCDILVIGGLIRNVVTDTTDKVPYLSSIPGVGLLFQHKVRRLEKRNLVVFLKPVIMHSPEDANALTHQKYEQTRQVQINWPAKLTDGEQKLGNILPSWKNNTVLPKPFES